MMGACLDRERTANGSTFAHLHLCGECSERWNKARSIHESLVTAFKESVPKPSEDAINRLFTTLRPTSATPCPAIVTPPAEAVEPADLGGHCRSSSSDCRKASDCTSTNHTGSVNSASSTVVMGGDSGHVANAI